MEDKKTKEQVAQDYMDDLYDSESTEEGKRAAAKSGVDKIQDLRTSGQASTLVDYKPGPGRGGYVKPSEAREKTRGRLGKQ